MRGDAKTIFLITCGAWLLHMLGFWLSMGHWPFGGEGPGTTLLKSQFGNDFDVPFLGDCFMRGTLTLLFYPVLLLAWTLRRASEGKDDETTDAEDTTGEPEEFVIEE